MTDTAPVLIVMRLADMHRVHPRQDNSRTCPRCGERVGIYPSGQKALRRVRGLTIICEKCHATRPCDVLILAPGAEAEPGESRPIARR